MDVVICGGGIVGLVIANLLARNSERKILLLEPNLPQLALDTTTYDLRCSALSIAAQRILQHINVWDSVLAARMGIYQKMFVWSDELHQHVTFAAQDIGHAQLGYIVENRVLSKALYEQLLKYKNVTILNQSATNMVQHATHVTLTVGTTAIDTKLLIAADGANSWVRTAIKVPQHHWDCQQSALVATVQTQYSHANCAQQRFSPDGILAFLPLQEPNLCSIVWSAAPTLVAKRMQMNEVEFNTMLAREFGFKLGQVEVIGARASFPLRMQHAVEYACQRVVLLGDAAHVVHPMAGQGLNLGLLDAAVLFTIINKAADPGAAALLHKYTQQRRWHNSSMIFGLLALKRIFATQNAGVPLLRWVGLRMLNHALPVKRQIMKFACGLTEDLKVLTEF